MTLLTDAAATRDAVTKALEALAAKAGEEDTVVLVLIGHGTFDGKVAKFNLPGPDMTPADFAPLLAKLQSKRVVFVNTASASGPFVEALSGPGRIIVSATRTGDEKFATLFGGQFVDAFSTEGGGRRRDGKVSILEAFDYAKRAVAAAYEREGHDADRARAARRQRRQAGQHGAGPAGEGRPVGGGARLGSMRQQALPADQKLRALYVERRRSSGGRSAEAPEEQHGAGEVRGGAREARDRARAQDAADPRSGREGQMKAALIGLALALTTTAAVDRRRRVERRRSSSGGGGRRFQQQGPPLEVQGNTPYDGRFVFVRLRYNTGFGGRSRGGPPWSHDYPRGEVHFTKILKEITYVQPRLDGSNILALDDPELFNYPIAYMAEPGFWAMTTRKPQACAPTCSRAASSSSTTSAAGIDGALGQPPGPDAPRAAGGALDRARRRPHPVWHSFFEIEPDGARGAPDLRRQGDAADVLGDLRGQRSDEAADGDRQRQQRHQRVLGVLRHRLRPVDLTNEAYKFGVNYVIYGLTH